MILIFDILPNDTSKPNGSENKRVAKNIPTVPNMPPDNWLIIAIKLIFIFLTSG